MCLNIPFKYETVATVATGGVVYTGTAYHYIEPGESVIVGTGVMLVTAWDEDDEEECW